MVHLDVQYEGKVRHIVFENNGLQVQGGRQSHRWDGGRIFVKSSINMESIFVSCQTQTSTLYRYTYKIRHPKIKENWHEIQRLQISCSFLSLEVVISCSHRHWILGIQFKNRKHIPIDLYCVHCIKYKPSVSITPYIYTYITNGPHRVQTVTQYLNVRFILFPWLDK